MSFERIKDTHRHQMVTITPRKKAMRSRLSFKIGFIAVLSLWFCIHMSIFQTPFYSEKISPKHFHQPSQKRLEKRLEFVHITKTGGSAIEKVAAEKDILWGACHYLNVSDVGCKNPDFHYTVPTYQSYVLTSPWHTPPKVLKKYISKDLFPYEEASLFAIVRNPYSRAVSEYYCPWTGYEGPLRKSSDKTAFRHDPDIMNKWISDMVTRLEINLETFNEEHIRRTTPLNEDPYILAQKHFVNQAEYFVDNGKAVIDHVVRYENLTEEFSQLMRLYGLDLKIPPKEKSGIYTDTSGGEKKLTHLDLYPDTIAKINKYAQADFDLFGYEQVETFESGRKYSLAVPESGIKGKRRY